MLNIFAQSFLTATRTVHDTRRDAAPTVEVELRRRWSAPAHWYRSAKRDAEPHDV